MVQAMRAFVEGGAFAEAEARASAEAAAESEAEARRRAEIQDMRGALANVKPEDLRGLLSARTPKISEYFGHFAALLHLETYMRYMNTTDNDDNNNS